MKSRWEQDGRGGDHGVATFELGGREIDLAFPTFKAYWEFHQVLEVELAAAYRAGRRVLLAEVARIPP